MNPSVRPFYLAGEWLSREGHRTRNTLDVRNPFDGTLVATVALASQEDMERAIEETRRGFEETRTLGSYERAEILAGIAAQLSAHKDEVAHLITLEAGKPILFSRLEVDRAIMTFQVASEEAKRIPGEVIPLDLNAASRDRIGLVRRFPLGVILAISPFNFPLNLVAHKVAPAMAAGNAFILKPSSSTPLTALRLAEAIEAAGYPKRGFAVLATRGSDAEMMVKDDRLKMITFTGSADIGWYLKTNAGKKRVLLELGGNAGVIVDETADLDLAVKKTAMAAFAYAGQVCIKTQRIYIHQNLFERFVEQFVRRTKELHCGDPMDDRTIVGPVIDDQSAERIISWIEEAVAMGAKVLTGGHRTGRVIEPTVLTNVDRRAKAFSQEIFGPVVTLHPFATIDEAVAGVNDSRYGLQAGVFTNNLQHAFYAYRNLEAGGVIVNESSSYRIDPMPYGGTKDSGLGREGIRYAIEEMTEPKLLVVEN